MTDDRDQDIAAIRGVTRLAGVIVDDETGQILEWPELELGVDRLEWVGRQRSEARTQENAWKAAGGFYQKVIGELMGLDELKRYDGETVAITSSSSGDRRYGDPVLLRKLEVGPRRERRAMLLAVTRLDLDVIRELESRRLLPRGTAAEITQGSVGATYFRVSAKRHPAPQIEKGMQEAIE